MTGFGGMISFEPKGGEITAYEILKATRLFVLAESLGGVESLISCRYTMTHASLTRDPRMKIRIGKELYPTLSRDRGQGRSHRRPKTSSSIHKGVVAVLGGSRRSRLEHACQHC